ncbi:hypothetical protein EDC18_101431 [Natranaerovirga pectinivora]|uniref:Uncharacterized protein n=1 Tax=Natranaerovirga pectinivora TaxID=682400 RepID=A0A4R3MRJ5_9FIRM|nr:hypothetical protein [Natranaerovirga pectinivora]TCT17133.1 hypothetical protein EDC18_101431 [Natranaerovirga pectinivora]
MSWLKKHKVRFVLSILILFLVLLITYFYPSYYMNDVEQIYVSHSSYGVRTSEYKIDFTEKKFYQFNHGGSYKPRDKTLDNEGYQMITDISINHITIFNKKAQRYRFLRWKERYINHNVEGGHHWSIYIFFKDGEVKKIYGVHKYPLTWNKMLMAFEELTGSNILYKKIRW